ncbi:MAG: hypothetical protein KAT28_01755 [Candidatus Aenigmarchaeota archaeon]|nr:hypothetical protein [Candidatus Aenigmarchaeota archaeon]
MNSKTKTLIGVLVIGILLICGWWIWNNQKQISVEEFCTSNILEDCDGKKVKIVGVFETTKGCMGVIYVENYEGKHYLSQILLREFANKCEEAKKYSGEKVEVIGLVKNTPYSPDEQWMGMEITNISSIEILENQNS